MLDSPTPLVDIVIIPLATWLYLLSLFLFVFSHVLSERRRAEDSPPTFYDAIRLPESTGAANKAPNLIDPEAATPTVPSSTNPDVPASNSNPAPPTTSRNLRTALDVASSLYVLLHLTLTIIVIVEFARLSTSRLGVGLLPFTLPGVLIAALVRLVAGSPKVKGTKWGLLRWLNVVYWALLGVVYVVGIVATAKGGYRYRWGYDRREQIGHRVGVVVLTLGLGVLEVVAVKRGGWREVKRE